MTPQVMSALHHAAFTNDRGWSAAEFVALLENPHVQTFSKPHGFALTRTVAGESELLTIAVDPAHQRKGIAKSLLQDWLAAIASTAPTVFLEVAADNKPARALYASLGFLHIASRPAYYRRKGGRSADALILRRDLTLGQSPESTPKTREIG